MRRGPRPGRVADSESAHFLSLSRLTDPGDFRKMLGTLPRDPDGVCEVAAAQTIHRNLLGHFGLTIRDFEGSPRVWPPRLDGLLERLSQRDPRTLSIARPPTARLLGACVQESYFLVGLLRFRRIPARVRVGYFRNIMGNPAVTLPFWRAAQAALDPSSAPRAHDPVGWEGEVDAFTRHQLKVDHHIEHWIAEFWDAPRKEWVLLDAHPEFLKAHSGIDVPYRLPRHYFEPAWEAWQRMRRDPDYDPDQHAEGPLDGRSHLQVQLISDFCSLLNHDVPGSLGSVLRAPPFPGGRLYQDVGSGELSDLDHLARLLSGSPTVEELVGFCGETPSLRSPEVEADPWSFVSRP